MRFSAQMEIWWENNNVGRVEQTPGADVKKTRGESVRPHHFPLCVIAMQESPVVRLHSAPTCKEVACN